MTDLRVGDRVTRSPEAPQASTAPWLDQFDTIVWVEQRPYTTGVVRVDVLLDDGTL